ncbi:protein of unknown function [Legionella fallonii LLAP-10]|uniref:Uncharacterized protein n=1 Tax=Legionella fallonii LLAP-10 TaxID=1212491 RepID=A0A098G231_9GAMM|nr:protein of unknown function [Legionella fallonii LLAP-10]
MATSAARSEVFTMVISTAEYAFQAANEQIFAKKNSLIFFLNLSLLNYSN